MSAASARHFPTRDSERALRRPASDDRSPAQAQQQARARLRAQRRQRQRHFARRRRDLLEDLGFGLILTVLLGIFTAGLGVIALLEIPLGLALVASVLVPRARRRRAAQAAPRRRRPL
jgi:predicted lipid-binding transport protein (Tim44 family)